MGTMIIQYPAGTIRPCSPPIAAMVRDGGAHDGRSARDARVLSPLHVPGMTHCYFGPARQLRRGSARRFRPCATLPRRADSARALGGEGCRPERIVATKYTDDKAATRTVRLTRPLCVHPGVAQYSGSGDPNDAASFVCRGGARQRR